MYYGPILHIQFFIIRHAALPKHRSLYCGSHTQTAVFRHRFRSRCRGTDREIGSKASIWWGLCVVNIHFWCLGEEKSHIPYFKTRPQDKRGYNQRGLEDEAAPHTASELTSMEHVNWRSPGRRKSFCRVAVVGAGWMDDALVA